MFTLTVGVVSLVAAATLSEVGAVGAIVSKAWLCAVEIDASVVALPIEVAASAIALCAAALFWTAAGNRLVIVLASARPTVAPPALLTTKAKLDSTVAPLPAEAVSAMAAIVAICAAAFCASTLPDESGS